MSSPGDPLLSDSITAGSRGFRWLIDYFHWLFFTWIPPGTVPLPS